MLASSVGPAFAPQFFHNADVAKAYRCDTDGADQAGLVRVDLVGCAGDVVRVRSPQIRYDCIDLDIGVQTALTFDLVIRIAGLHRATIWTIDLQHHCFGTASTYQAMEHQDDAFWKLFDDYRVFAVFDEIHHCDGYDPLLSNAWGQQILLKMQDRAAFTLALSGTPWRSDDRGIALARYSNPEGRLICDYRYGLKEAISDGVCRSPRIVLLDNQMLRLKEDFANDSTVKLFSSIAKLLRESPVSYEDLVCHQNALSQLLDLGSKKLDEVRILKPNAAGLVVTTNIEHAHQVALGKV